MGVLNDTADAVVDALSADGTVAAEVSGDVAVRLMNPTVLVTADNAEWSLHRDLVAVTIECWATNADPSLAPRQARELGDAVYEAVQRIDSGVVWWAGPPTDLTVQADPDPVSVDGAEWERVTITATMVRDRTGPLPPASDTVETITDILRSADIPVGLSGDRGTFAVVRDAGSDDSDPTVQIAGVWLAAELDSQQIGALYRDAWAALAASGEVVPGGVTVELASSGVPGSTLLHDVAYIVCRSVHGDD